MQSNLARATKRDQPPSTPGTSGRRARRWPFGIGILAVGALALAAPMVAAEPASAPVQPTAQPALPAQAVAARPARSVQATELTGPTKAEIDQLNRAILTNKLNENAWIATVQKRQAAEAAAAAAAKAKADAAAAAAAAAARAAAPKPAPSAGPATGRCGGDLPPCYIMQRESGGSITARNPRSSASGKWQFLDSTWAGFGGYARAYLAPESVQDAKARQLWAGGAGCGHWSAC